MCVCVCVCVCVCACVSVFPLSADETHPNAFSVRNNLGIRAVRNTMGTENIDCWSTVTTATGWHALRLCCLHGNMF